MNRAHRRYEYRLYNRQQKKQKKLQNMMIYAAARCTEILNKCVKNKVNDK